MGQADKKCPTWAQWEEWESCKQYCEQRGTMRSRTCYLDVSDITSDEFVDKNIQGRRTSENECVLDSNNAAAEYKDDNYYYEKYSICEMAFFRKFRLSPFDMVILTNYLKDCR